jgi:O-antigen/teichoic acid export membrane protein
LAIFGLSRQFLTLLGSEYGKAYLVAVVIGVGELTNMITSFNGGIIGYSKLYKFDIAFEAFLLIGNIILNIILVPIYGILGAAIATSITLIIYNLLKVMLVYKTYKFHPFSANNLKVLLTGIILIGLLQLNIIKDLKIENILEMAIAGIILFVLYGAILALFKYKNSFVKIIKRNRGE